MSKRKQDIKVKCLQQLDRKKTLRRSCTTRLSSLDTRSVLKLTVELTIPCAVKRRGSLPPVEAQYKVADGKTLQILRQFEVTIELKGKSGGVHDSFRLEKMISCGG